ncbi:hypothetical protein FDR10_20040 [Salmonella enterica]|nr:hypothetical protein [Salmonella enterica]EBT7486471.1 fimbria/pilus outer membrane usher protein [Salmonella enterica]
MGIFGNLTDRLNWGVSGGTSSYLNGNYSGDRAVFGASLNQLSSGGTGGSVSRNGSVQAMSAARSVVFSAAAADTEAVVNVKDTSGLKVTSGEVCTGDNSNLVVPLNSYNLNTVTVDAGSLSLDTELSNTIRQVVPSSQAVGWMPFYALKVHRYLLQVTLPHGTFVPGESGPGMRRGCHWDLWWPTGC